MIERPDREDTRPQQERVAEARANLAIKLGHLGREADRQAKAARTKTGRLDLLAVYAAHREVGLAEEALDQAVYDLRTARGEDG